MMRADNHKMNRSLFRFAPSSRLVRFFWVGTAILTWAGLIASLPGYYRWFVEQPVRQGFNTQGVLVASVSGLASLLSAMVSMALAVFIFRRKPNDRPAVFVSFYLLGFGFMMSGPLEMAEFLFTGQSLHISYVVQSVFFPLLGFLLLLLFPNGVITPAWFRWLIPVVGLLSLAALFVPVEDQILLRTTESRLVLGTLGAFLLSGLGAQVYRYLRVSTPLERLQTRTVLYGLGVQLLLMGISSIHYYNQPEDSLNTLRPENLLMNLMWWLSLTAMPISFTLAVVRSRLWDIDVVIRRTLIYAVLTAALALVYFGSVIFFQYASRMVIGHESPIAIVLTTLIIAALFTPLRAGIQAAIDRRFFRSKYNAEQALARFQYSTRDQVNLDGLEQDLTGIVQATVQPEWVGLWMRKLH